MARRQALGTENRPALETYERFLHDFPEYPDRVGVLQRMLPLAQKLGDTNRIPALERELQRLQSRP